MRATHVEAPPIDEPTDDGAAPTIPSRRKGRRGCAAHDLGDPADARRSGRRLGGSRRRDDATGRPAKPRRAGPSAPSSSPHRAATAPSVTDDPDFAGGSRARASWCARPARPPSPTPPARSRSRVHCSRRSGTSGSRRRSSGASPDRTSRATSCRLAPGIKVSKVANLKDDLAYALAATDIRILAPIPGKTAVGVEVPERAAADRAPRRRLPGAAAGVVAADGLARQGHRRPRDRRRPREDAAPAGRRHDRRRQVGVRQRDALLASCCAPPRTRCGSCWSTPSRSSSTTTSRSRTC